MTTNEVASYYYDEILDIRKKIFDDVATDGKNAKRTKTKSPTSLIKLIILKVVFIFLFEFAS